MKFLGENMKNLCVTGFAKDFIDMLPKALSIKLQIDKLFIIKIKVEICSSKVTVKRLKI